MRVIDLIAKKRDGFALTKDEIDFIITNYTNGTIPDYQMSALLMAIFLNKMTKEETVNLTLSMANSGDTLDLSAIDGFKVDKHSTGGVGDKATLVVAPIAASCGVPIAKMSGRALGFSGGTIDKLESFKGINLMPSTSDFIKQVNEIKIAVIAQTGDLAPADKKIYALRDVTATVDNMSLIASSIMSKKLAAGCDKIVLDVTVGSGAFMKDLDSAHELARIMVDIGNGLNRDTIGVISNMDLPLGCAVGNILEVKEAIDILKGNGPEDFKEVATRLATYMVMLGLNISEDEAMEKVIDSLNSGRALNKFKELINYQGGDISYIDDTSKFETAKYTYDLRAKKSGYIKHIKTDEIGRVSMILGAGREKKEDSIDYTAGLMIYKKTSDYVNENDIICTLHTNDESKIKVAEEIISNAYEFTDEQVEAPTLIYDIVK